jgi:hypothetical protein
VSVGSTELMSGAAVGAVATAKIPCK